MSVMKLALYTQCQKNIKYDKYGPKDLSKCHFNELFERYKVQKKHKCHQS